MEKYILICTVINVVVSALIFIELFKLNEKVRGLKLTYQILINDSKSEDKPKRKYKKRNNSNKETTKKTTKVVSTTGKRRGRPRKNK